MIKFKARNINTGEIIDFDTDCLFNDRYGTFILKNKNDWKFEVISQCSVKLDGRELVGMINMKDDPVRMEIKHNH